MIAARRYMGGRWYMPPGVHDLWGVEPVQGVPFAEWRSGYGNTVRSRDHAAEERLARELNDAFEAAELERCAALRVPMEIRRLTTGAEQWRLKSSHERHDLTRFLESSGHANGDGR